jgi:hypothetical protein
MLPRRARNHRVGRVGPATATDAPGSLASLVSLAMPLVLIVLVVLPCGTAHAEQLDEGVAFKSVALAGNPLGFIIGRYSVDLEYLPVPHHALHLTPVGYYALPGTGDQLTGFGAEVGYRWYSGVNGPEGFFVGGSFLAGDYEYIHGTAQQVPSPLDMPDDTQYVSLGGAIDVGYQAVVLGNFALGGGLGAQYTVFTEQPHFEYLSHPWHDLLYGSGLRPRVLLSVGAAW